jgi:glucokinase
MTMELVAVDIGGTHARFALATVEGGRVTHLGEAVTLKTAEHASFQLAWQEFQRINGGAVPSACAIAVAGRRQARSAGR